MRHLGVDDSFVTADQRGEIQGGIVNADGVSAAKERLCHLHHRTLTQIIGVGLERETKQDNLSHSRLHDQS